MDISKDIVRKIRNDKNNLVDITYTIVVPKMVPAAAQ